MTHKEYERNTLAKLLDKKATANVTIRNKRGDVIESGETVTILDKYMGFTVRSEKGVEIRRVSWHDITLIKES